MSKCDFRHQFGEDAEKTLSSSDWRLSLGTFAAQGVAQRLSSLDAVASQRRLQVRSDKCDFSVRLSAVKGGAANRPTVSAAMQSDKCDFSIALAGTMGNRQALSRIRTQMASEKCDFSVRLQFGEEAAPLFRVSAVASSKCDFQIREIEIRQASGQWKSVSLAAQRPTK